MKQTNDAPTSQILAIGTAAPAHSISQSDSCLHAQQFYQCEDHDKRGRSLRMLYKRTEIERRALVVLDKKDSSIDRTLFPAPVSSSDRGPGTSARMARYNLEIAPLAIEACRAALDLAKVKGAEITHLVTASCTGFAAPGFDLALIKALPLEADTARTHVGFMGCHGAFNALRVADAYCRADANATVLVCAAELCSVHMQYEWSAQRLVANALFADGAAAVVVRASSSYSKPSVTVSAPATYMSSRSIVIDGSSEAMSWHIGDNGFVMILAAEVPDLIEQHLPAFIEEWLAQNQLEVSDIKSWAVHPGGPRILTAVQDCLGLDSEMLSISRAVLGDYGNMSSPTVLFIVQKLLALGDKLPCVLLGFGPGLTVEAALVG